MLEFNCKMTLMSLQELTSQTQGINKLSAPDGGCQAGRIWPTVMGH